MTLKSSGFRKFPDWPLKENVLCNAFNFLFFANSAMHGDESLAGEGHGIRQASPSLLISIYIVVFSVVLDSSFCLSKV